MSALTQKVAPEFIPEGFLKEIQGQSRESLFRVLKALCFSHPRAVVITDKDNFIVEVNPKFEKMTGYTRDEALGQRPSLSKSNRHTKDFYQRMWTHINDHNHWEGEIWDRKKDGSVYPKWLRIDRFADDAGDTLFYMAVFHGLNEEADNEDVIDKLLYYDHLTGLPNRVLFRHHLEHEFQVSDRYGRKAGLMLVNIDRFSQINDGFGYLAGDELLISIAKRLEPCIRQTDLLAAKSGDAGEKKHRKADAISRFGGDEFSFILSDLKTGEGAAVVAERVMKAFEEPFELDGVKFYLNVSVGISVYPENGQTINELLRCAENALVRSKRDGGNEYTFFSDSMNKNMAERIRMEGNIRKAVKEQEFVLYYQPKVDITTGVVCGMEALIRWPQEDGTMMSPTEFIPLTEETGQIVPIGSWVLEQACRDIVAINIDYGKYLKVAVNISPKQFRQNQFLEMVRNIVTETECDPTFLELEITESMMMEDVEGAIQTMKEIRNIGITLSMDDFGTGYSSLAYLRQFPLDTLKIDRSFICGMMESSGDASIVSAICSIGRNLGLGVIAEGVEHDFEVPMLQEMGCTMIQGYLYGKPLPIAEFRAKFCDKQ